MGSGRTNEEIALYNAQVLADLEEYLHYLTIQGEPEDQRADKISQWVESWTRYLKREKDFNPKGISAFKRGSIVYADFGFNVGREYGGHHYAIVLNKKDSRKNHLLHVLPLTSVKEDTDLGNLQYFQKYIGSEVFQLMLQKALRVETEVEELREQLKSRLEHLQIRLNNIKDLKIMLEDFQNDFSINDTQQSEQVDSVIKTTEQEISEINNEIEENDKLMNDFDTTKDYLNKLIAKINKMKQGSIVLLNQITTVSKLRILDPREKDSVLKDIVLSSETMNEIDNLLNDFF
ncbi:MULTISPECIES: type II toxin-antitoxin system PemK/MazF family toxin [Streptococcus]|uniref:type II toxin-antitoxin system PemK/MazF family toxin n=1 Tax=Streptococcus TaxID=1301 RepID=UPI0012DF0FEE|nr:MULTISPECIES: type II toxin-antitoxin system PemK/MazF family toxin [Streptococcus]QHF55450.1 hypothetical protein BZG42_08900 [Streptococcus sp. DAT741]